MSNHIPESTIFEIRQACDIVDVVGDVVLLKKAGKNYIGLCPFHAEKTPSFTVSPDKQIFHCFGCGQGGNVFSFLMQHENITFPQAVRMLGSRCGIAIPDRHLTPDQKRQIDERELFLRANHLAMQFYQSNLLHRHEGKSALAYLHHRQLTRDTIAAFKLGLATPGWERLLRHLKQRNLPVEALEKCGLISQRRNQKGYYDRFRNRIIFPIIDQKQQVIGFGGRVMDDASPKYLNSPETPLFNKSHALYGLSTCKTACRDNQQIYIVEGYMDAIALYQNGIHNVAATMGTALTTGHIRIIKGLIGDKGTVLLVFDSDEAGTRAAMRSIDLFQSEHVDVRILVLKQGYDPDTFVMEYGPEAFRQNAENAFGIIPFLLEVNQKKYGRTIEGKIRIIDELETPLAAVKDKVIRSLYISEVAEKLDISETALAERIEQSAARSARNLRARAESGEQTRTQTSHRRSPNGTGSGIGPQQYRLERQVVAMMLQYPAILPQIIKSEMVDFFDDPSLKSIASKVVRIFKEQRDMARPAIGENQIRRPAAWVDELEPLMDDKDQASVLYELALKEEDWNEEGCRKLLQQFENVAVAKQNRELERQIQAAERAHDSRKLFELLAEKQKRAVSRAGCKSN